MIARIFIGIFVGIIILLVLFWVITGGPSKTVAGAKAQPNIVESILNGDFLGTLFSFKLPWRGSIPDLQNPDISQYIGDSVGTEVGEIRSPQDRGDLISPTQKQIEEARNFGMPSPYRSRITLQEGAATQSDPAKEYLRIASSRDNDGDIDLAGWSVQSAVSGRRLYLPEAAAVFEGGAINALDRVVVPPGGGAIIASGVSPVGASFRENICSGYLGKLQSFHPSLVFASCPNPADALTETATNLRTYGSSCLDYVRDLSPCEFPQDPPATLSPACRAFVTDTFSYNGCVRRYRTASAFLRGSWRLYLNSQTNLWDNTHDIIRLLDAEGRTVDAVTY